MFKKWWVLAIPVVATLWASTAMAGTGGLEFEEIYSMLTDWTQGFLGKVIALGAFLAGVCIGIIRQSLMAIVLGVAGATAVYYTPNIIDGIVAALL